MIYILRTDSGSETFYKIGYTKKEISKRIKSLQTGCPYKLELVRIFQGTQEKEKEIHSILKSSRFHGEWFRDDFLVRETLNIYDFKGFPFAEFEPTSDQERVINFFKEVDGWQFWPLGTFLKKLAIDEDSLRRIPYGKRGFSIALHDHELMSSFGVFHGDPFKGKLLCICSRN
jgi:hypothetical protein